MKTTTKLIGILSALIVVILAIFLVTKFNSHESARVSSSSSPARTVKKSSSSSSKTVKKDKKAIQSSAAVSSKENDNQDSAVAPKASSQKQAQVGTTDGGQVAQATTPASQVGGVEGGRGAWTATSGTLTLDEETPVYAAPDKDSGAVSTLPAGDIAWDKYEILPDGNWYSFVKDGQRYYISYSDVGH